jgi:hypothetical protein
MRAVFGAAILVATAACHSEGQQEGRWHLRPASAQAVARIDYEFGDSEHTRFIGRCDGSPIFILAGGDYTLNASQFTLIVDSKSWELRASQGEHSRFLGVETFAPAAAIIHAKRLITFRVGKWQRQFRPSPMLQQFSSQCS